MKRIEILHATVLNHDLNCISTRIKGVSEDVEKDFQFYCSLQEAKRGGPEFMNAWVAQCIASVEVALGEAPVSKPAKEETKPAPKPAKEEPKPAPKPAKEEAKEEPKPAKEEPKEEPKEETKPAPKPAKEEPKEELKPAKEEVKTLVYHHQDHKDLAYEVLVDLYGGDAKATLQKKTGIKGVLTSLKNYLTEKPLDPSDLKGSVRGHVEEFIKEKEIKKEEKAEELHFKLEGHASEDLNDLQRRALVASLDTARMAMVKSLGGPGEFKELLSKETDVPPLMKRVGSGEWEPVPEFQEYIKEFLEIKTSF